MDKGAVYKNTLVTVVLLCTLAGLLLAAGPGGAVTVTTSSPNSPVKGDPLKFNVITYINTTELVPVKYANITIEGPTTKNCTLYINGTSSCSDVSFSLDSTTLDYGYGLGNTSQYGADLGYVNGYGVNGSSGNLKFKVSWNTRNANTGNYNVTSIVYVEGLSKSYTFSSSAQTFAIRTSSGGVPVTGGGGGSSPSPAEEEAEPEEESVEEYPKVVGSPAVEEPEEKELPAGEPQPVTGFEGLPVEEEAGPVPLGMGLMGFAVAAMVIGAYWYYRRRR